MNNYLTEGDFYKLVYGDYDDSARDASFVVEGKLLTAKYGTKDIRKNNAASSKSNNSKCSSLNTPLKSTVSYPLSANQPNSEYTFKDRLKDMKIILENAASIAESKMPSDRNKLYKPNDRKPSLDNKRYKRKSSKQISLDDAFMVMKTPVKTSKRTVGSRMTPSADSEMFRLKLNSKNENHAAPKSNLDACNEDYVTKSKAGGMHKVESKFKVKSLPFLLSEMSLTTENISHMVPKTLRSGGENCLIWGQIRNAYKEHLLQSKSKESYQTFFVKYMQTMEKDNKYMLPTIVKDEYVADIWSTINVKLSEAKPTTKANAMPKSLDNKNASVTQQVTNAGFKTNVVPKLKLEVNEINFDESFDKNMNISEPTLVIVKNSSLVTEQIASAEYLDESNIIACNKEPEAPKPTINPDSIVNVVKSKTNADNCEFEKSTNDDKVGALNQFENNDDDESGQTKTLSNELTILKPQLSAENGCAKVINVKSESNLQNTQNVEAIVVSQQPKHDGHTTVPSLMSSTENLYTSYRRFSVGDFVYAIESGFTRFGKEHVEALAMSLSRELSELDEIISHYRQVSADLRADFNTTLTPFGLAYLVCKKMDDLYVEFQERSQHKLCAVECKRCLISCLKRDPTLFDELWKNVDKHFGLPREISTKFDLYDKFVEAFKNCNRFILNCMCFSNE